MAFLSLLKTKFIAIGGAIIAILLGVVKFLAARNRALKTQVKTVKKSLKFQQDVIESEQEIDSEFSDLKREAAQDVKKGEIPAHLADPRK